MTGLEMLGNYQLDILLLSDQDFLIEPFGINESYSAQSDAIEIVGSKSFIEEGFVMLRVSRCMARRFKLKKVFLSTNTIKHSVKRCISKVPKTNFSGRVRRDFVHCLNKLLLSAKQHMKIHGLQLMWISGQ